MVISFSFICGKWSIVKFLPFWRVGGLLLIALENKNLHLKILNIQNQIYLLFIFPFKGIIILRSIPYFEETKKFSLFLPNPWNVSFYFPTAMRLYLLCGLFPRKYDMLFLNARSKI